MNPPDVNPAARISSRSAQQSNGEGPRAAPVVRPEHAEGSFTRVLEQQTAKIPSSFFLVSAVTAMAASVVFEIRGQKRMSNFVGMWAPTLMIAGVYNKLIKTLGSR